MKYLNFLIILLCIFESVVFAKESNHKKNISHKTQQPKSKTISISIHPKPTIDMQVNFSSSHRLENIIITPNTDSIRIDIQKTNNNDPVNFTIFPAKLAKYIQKPKEHRKHYNFNSDFDGLNTQRPLHSGEERLFQALATSVEYSYDKLPTDIVLPNPMEILHDLLGCNC